MHSEGKRKRDEEVLKVRGNIKITLINIVVSGLGGNLLKENHAKVVAAK
jgi:hypothetical protein